MTLVATTLAPALEGRSAPLGDPSAVRLAATRLEEHEQAGVRAVRGLIAATGRLEDAWRDDAGTAATDALRRLAERASELGRLHGRAAEALTCCAGELEQAQETWRRACALERRDLAERAARVAAEAGGARVSPYEADHSPLRAQARWLADEAVRTAAAASRRASNVLDDLADRMPAEGDRARAQLTAADQVRGFGTGAADAVTSSVDVLVGLSVPSLVLDRDGRLERVRLLGHGIEQAARHPGDALIATLGLDVLQEGRYGEWVGSLAPDVLGGVLTGGGLRLARRSAHVADELSDLADDVADLRRVTTRAEAVAPWSCATGRRA